MTATEHVILVDQDDNPIGTAEKLAAHQQGLCHRAFSIFIFRAQVTLEILLQQRAAQKYHSPNLWTNTCCSHPRPGEDILQAGQRRLQEEMGIQATLRLVDKFHYVAHFANGLVENEIDHVLVAALDDPAFQVNPSEVQAYRWIELPAVEKELKNHPATFTPWFKQALAVARKGFG